MAIMAHIKRT